MHNYSQSMQGFFSEIFCDSKTDIYNSCHHVGVLLTGATALHRINSVDVFRKRSSDNETDKILPGSWLRILEALLLNQRGRDLLARRRRTARRGDPTILNNSQRRKFSSEHNLARGAQPFVEHSPVNATEVSVEFQIAVIQVGQARVFPE